MAVCIGTVPTRNSSPRELAAWHDIELTQEIGRRINVRDTRETTVLFQTSNARPWLLKRKCGLLTKQYDHRMKRRCSRLHIPYLQHSRSLPCILCSGGNQAIFRELTSAIRTHPSEIFSKPLMLKCGTIHRRCRLSSAASDKTQHRRVRSVVKRNGLSTNTAHGTVLQSSLARRRWGTCAHADESSSACTYTRSADSPTRIRRHL